MRITLISVFFVLSGLLVGCGGPSGPDRGPLGTLSGMVTFDGVPLDEGDLYLQHKDGAGAGGGGAEIQTGGIFDVAGGQAGGIPVGTYVVWVSPPEVEVPGVGADPSYLEEKEMPNMPQKYRSKTTSGLTVEIAAGENVQDFDLTP